MMGLCLVCVDPSSSPIFISYNFSLSWIQCSKMMNCVEKSWQHFSDHGFMALLVNEVIVRRALELV